MINKEIEKYLEDKGYVSYSELSTYLECQVKWYMQYVKNIRVSNIHFEFGSMAHEVLETRRLPNKHLTDFDKFEEAFGIKDWDLYFNTIFKELDTLFEDYKVISREFEFNINNIKGVVDLILYNEEEDLYYIYDYKFSNSIKTTDDILLDQQLYIYAVAVAKHFDVDIRKIKVGYISIPKKPINSPLILTSGKLSKAKSQSVTYDSYMAKLKELNLNVEDYEDFLIELKNKKIVDKIETFVNIDYLKRIMTNIEIIVNKDMKKGYILECWNSYHCKNCPLKEYCKINNKT